MIIWFDVEIFRVMVDILIVSLSVYFDAKFDLLMETCNWLTDCMILLEKSTNLNSLCILIDLQIYLNS